MSFTFQAAGGCKEFAATDTTGRLQDLPRRSVLYTRLASLPIALRVSRPIHTPPGHVSGDLWSLGGKMKYTAIISAMIFTFGCNDRAESYNSIKTDIVGIWKSNNVDDVVSNVEFKSDGTCEYWWIDPNGVIESVTYKYEVVENKLITTINNNKIVDAVVIDDGGLRILRDIKSINYVRVIK